MEYKIQKGDTLWDLSKKFNVPIEEIAKINGISNPDMIQAGKMLYIPRQGPETGSVIYQDPSKKKLPPVQAKHYMSAPRPGARTLDQARESARMNMDMGLLRGTLDGAGMVAGAGPAWRGVKSAGEFAGATGRQMKDDLSIMFSKEQPWYRPTDLEREGVELLPGTSSVFRSRRPAHFLPEGSVQRGVPRYGGQSRRSPDISTVGDRNYVGKERTLRDLESMVYGGGY